MKKLIVLVVVLLGMLCLLAAPALASAKTIIVKPIGNDQTAALEAAFAGAGPGDTVQLTAGHFYINDILVTGFHGAFKGAGEGKNGTVIDTLRGNPKTPNAPGVTLMTPDYPNFTFLLGFKDGAVRVSDLSFDITSSAPAEAWSGEFGGTNYFIETIVYPVGESSASFDHVAYRGHAGDFYGMNTDQSVWAEGDATQSGGTFTFTRCTCATLEGVGDYGLAGARITVGGSACQGNLFKSAGVGCFFNDTDSSNVVVSGNRFQVGNDLGGALYSAGVTLFQGDNAAPAPSRYLVSGNTMQVASPGDGVDVFDWGPLVGVGQLINAVVSSNRITLSGALDLPQALNAAGVGEYYAQNVRVLANHISGTGLAGIYLGIPLLGDDASGSVSGWQIIGNDVSHVTAAEAPIWLGPGTTDCTVIGGCARTGVLDQGMDNTLINVTPVTASLVAPALSMRANAGASTKLGLMQKPHQGARP